MKLYREKSVYILLVCYCCLLTIPRSQAQDLQTPESAQDDLQAYHDCLAREATEQYQLAYEECLSQGMGSDVEGGCETIAGVKSLEYESSIDYDCESLKPYTDE